MDLIKLVAQSLNKDIEVVAFIVNSKNEGSTVPFMARYRKEATRGMNEAEIREVLAEYERLEKLEKRRESILSKLEDNGKLTPELKKSIQEAESLNELEEIYAPFKSSRKTKTDEAREKGLEPICNSILRAN